MARTRRLRAASALIASIAISLTSVTTAAHAASPVITTERTFVSVIQPSCEVDGTVEQVHLSGYVTHVFQVVVDANGTFHAHLVSHPEGVAGYGLTTGMRYRWVGGTTIVNNIADEGFPNEFEWVDTYLLIAQGRLPNIVVHEVIHGYFDEDGEDVILQHYYSGWDCR